MLESDVQPGLALPVVVDHGSSPGAVKIGVLLVAQAQHVPGWVDRVDVAPERYQRWWQRPKLPQGQVRLQILRQMKYKHEHERVNGREIPV